MHFLSGLYLKSKITGKNKLVLLINSRWCYSVTVTSKKRTIMPPGTKSFGIREKSCKHKIKKVKNSEILNLNGNINIMSSCILS